MVRKFGLLCWVTWALILIASCTALKPIPTPMLSPSPLLIPTATSTVTPRAGEIVDELLQFLDREYRGYGTPKGAVLAKQGTLNLPGVRVPLRFSLAYVLGLDAPLPALGHSYQFYYFSSSADLHNARQALVDGGWTRYEDGLLGTERVLHTAPPRLLSRTWARIEKDRLIMVDTTAREDRIADAFTKGILGYIEKPKLTMTDHVKPSKILGNVVVSHSNFTTQRPFFSRNFTTHFLKIILPPPG